MSGNTPWGMRPPAGDADYQRIVALVWAYPTENLHVCDLPYRLCSPGARSAEDARLWEDENGDLLAFAIVQHTSFGTLDYFIRPDARNQGIEVAMIAWATPRFQHWTTAAGRDLSWWIDSRTDQPDRLALAAQCGFARDNWHTVHMLRPLDQPIPEPQLPVGFTIRPLAGEAEVEAMVALHRAAFDTENMTVAWRRATLALPQYDPAHDLVVEAPDGRLAAFCLCWRCPATGEAQVEPMGAHPDFQRLGLGRALLDEQFRRLRAAGVTNAVVETYSVFESAIALYASVGFRVVQTIEKYAKDFASSAQ